VEGVMRATGEDTVAWQLLLLLLMVMLLLLPN
jgi:hypothetical protein